MRCLVEALTLDGSLKNFESVGREMPLSAANTSMYFIFLAAMHALASLLRKWARPTAALPGIIQQ
jgi:hypothetical protein